jgi:hypothetical protein
MSFAKTSDPVLHANQLVHKELKRKLETAIGRVDLKANEQKVPYFYGGITNIPEPADGDEDSDDEPQGYLRLVTSANCHLSAVLRVEEQLGIMLPILAIIIKACPFLPRKVPWKLFVRKRRS